MHYVAGWNQPGFLPEMELFHTESFVEAKQVIIDELMKEADDWGSQGDEEYAESLTNLAEEVNLESKAFEVHSMDSYVYWVTEKEIS